MGGRRWAVGVLRPAGASRMENERRTDNRFLAPGWLSAELSAETAACPMCREIRGRTNVAGAVCFTHFLKAGRQKPQPADPH